MLTSKQNDTAFIVHYRSYRLALLLLVLPPLMLAEHFSTLLDGSIGKSDLAALAIGVLVPLLAAYLLIELASFGFYYHDNIFRWRWRNLLRRKSLDLPLDRIIGVKRETMELNDSDPRSRLIVLLDDGSVVGLTRGYSDYQGKQLDKIVDEIREYLGHVVPMR